MEIPDALKLRYPRVATLGLFLNIANIKAEDVRFIHNSKEAYGRRTIWEFINLCNKLRTNEKKIFPMSRHRTISEHGLKFSLLVTFQTSFYQIILEVRFLRY